MVGFRDEITEVTGLNLAVSGKLLGEKIILRKTCLGLTSSVHGEKVPPVAEIPVSYSRMLK